MLYVEYALRYVMEAIFCYMIYKNKDDCYQKFNYRKMFIFCAVYVIAGMTCKILTPEQNVAIIRLLLAIIIFAYFRIENKKTNALGYIFTFSILINLIIESSYMFGYILVRFGAQFFSKSEHLDVMISENLMLFMFIVSIFHSCFMLLIYKTDFIKIKTIKNLAMYRFISISFGIFLLAIIYLKHVSKQLPMESSFVWVLCYMFLLVAPLFLGLYQHISKHIELKNRDKNHNINNFFFQWILHPPSKTKFIVNAGGDTLSFLDKYEYITSEFIKKLNAMGINGGNSGYGGLIFCLFITSMLRGTRDWSFKEDVFGMTEELLDMPEGALRKSIAKMIKNTWELEPYEILEREYYSFCYLKNYNENSNPPNAEIFLTNMANRSGEILSLEELKSNNNTSAPIARHGGLVSVYGEVVLITGASGVCKSDTALKLVKRNHVLIADDMVELRKMKHGLYGNASQASQNFMESRGLGLVNVKRLIGAGAVQEVGRIDLVVKLIAWEEGKESNCDRIGEVQHRAEILGVQVPYVNIFVVPGRDMADIIETAVLNNRQRFMGFAAPSEFFENIGMEGSKIAPKVMTEKDIWGV